MKIWLIGMMGSGETSAGALAAGDPGVPLMDTDRIIEQRIGESVSSFWSANGEDAFRDVESSVVEKLVGEDGIVATGEVSSSRPTDDTSLTRALSCGSAPTRRPWPHESRCRPTVRCRLGRKIGSV